MAKRHQKEFDLPQEIIHHIQSFLNTKESGQTSILSKSWYSAWLTRPVLVFDEDDFSKPTRQYDNNDSHPLPIFAKITLNRYKTLNLKADKFVLRMRLRCSHPFNPLAHELVSSALTLGLNEIVLEFRHFYLVRNRFSLPAHVFACTSLTRLSVECQWIDVVLIGNRVLCSRLKSLFLRHVSITDNVVRDILLGCPLIENLDLNCHGLGNINVSKQLNLVEFCVISGDPMGMRVEFMDGRNIVTEYHYLRKLDFNGVRLGDDDDFFTKFSTMFPCIEDVTLHCGHCQLVNISSNSLRRLSLYSGEMLNKVQLNVPNISKFVFQAHYHEQYDDDIAGNHLKPLPSLSFDNVLRDCESDVDLLFHSYSVIEASLIADLNKFLTQMTRSRISLRVAFDGQNVMSLEELPSFPSVPVVEKMRVRACSNWRSNRKKSILLGLSRSCANMIIVREGFRCWRIK